MQNGAEGSSIASMLPVVGAPREDDQALTELVDALVVMRVDLVDGLAQHARR